MVHADAPTAPERIDEILAFWFGPLDDDGLADPAAERRWWRKDDAFDAEIRRRFEATRRAILAGEGEAWLHTPRGRLAYVIALDQFSRNVGRGSPAAFEGDERALEVVRDGLRLGHDRALPPSQRAFLYMPLLHAEDRACQAQCCALFQEWLRDASDTVRGRLGGHLESAEQHREIVDRFGRFPHRNGTLGRETTPEEAAFLEGPGSSF